MFDIDYHYHLIIWMDKASMKSTEDNRYLGKNRCDLFKKGGNINIDYFCL